MCWKSKTKPIFKIADKNIKVLKILNWNMTSFYQHFDYEYNKEYSTEFRISCDDKYYFINKGFHSYSTEVRISLSGLTYGTIMSKKGMFLDSFLGTSTLIIAECIIPKGARYIENEDNEIVSDKIIIKQQIGKL